MTTTTVIPIAELTAKQTADWIALLPEDGPMSSPFVRPEYAVFAGRALPNVEVAILSHGEANLGFLPFERHPGDVGLPVGQYMSSLHGVVADAELQWDAEMLVRDCGLNAWQFDHLVADQTPFEPYHCYRDDSFFMDLSEGFEAYAEQRRDNGSSVIKQAARKQRKLQRELGPIRFSAHTTDQSSWDAFVRWKSEQLIRQGYANMFQLDWVNALLEELRTVSEADFSALLSTVHAGDTLIAVHLGLKSPTVVDSWIPAFANEYAKYSPGLILQVELARWAAESGITRVDLGRGENQMKLSLASGAFDVAVGSVDRRIVQRTWTRTYYGLRNLVHSSPFRNVSQRAVQRIKTWLS